MKTPCNDIGKYFACHHKIASIFKTLCAISQTQENQKKDALNEAVFHTISDLTQNLLNRKMSSDRKGLLETITCLMSGIMLKNYYSLAPRRLISWDKQFQAPACIASQLIVFSLVTRKMSLHIFLRLRTISKSLPEGMKDAWPALTCNNCLWCIEKWSDFLNIVKVFWAKNLYGRVFIMWTLSRFQQLTWCFWNPKSRFIFTSPARKLVHVNTSSLSWLSVVVMTVEVPESVFRELLFFRSLLQNMFFPERSSQTILFFYITITLKGIWRTIFSSF